MPLLLILIQIYLTHSFAGTIANCHYIYQNQSAQSNEIQNAIPANLIKILNRYKESEEALWTKAVLMKNNTGLSVSETLPGKGTVTFRVYDFHDGLFVDIVHVQAIEDGKHMSIKKSSLRPNLFFAKVMSGITNFIISEVSQNTNYKRIYVGAVNVKHPLIQQWVLDFGFSLVKTEPFSKHYQLMIDI